MPSISILISVYNGEECLNQALESIVAQSFQDFEIICIDDCSTDTTPDLLKKWRERLGETLVVERNPHNLGVTKSLNIALKKTRGHYIARLDADDVWAPYKLEKQIAFLESHPDYGIVGTNHYNLYPHQQAPKEIRLPETDEEIREKIFRRNPFAHSTILARTALIQKVGGYDGRIRYGQDYDLWLRCFQHTKFYNIQEFLCTRKIAGSISVTHQNAQMHQSIKTRLRYIHRYGYGFKSYFYLLEPLLVILTPAFIKNIKRRYL